MINLTYKKIPQQDEQQVRALINQVLGELERPEFFIPYTEQELEKFFDENYAPLY
jgi:hypothetical protein